MTSIATQIFKIRARNDYTVERLEQEKDQEHAGGLLSFRKGQPFYALCTDPVKGLYFVSTQFAVPFSRTAVSGFVPISYFDKVDLLSKDPPMSSSSSTGFKSKKKVVVPVQQQEEGNTQSAIQVVKPMVAPTSKDQTLPPPPPPTPVVKEVLTDISNLPKNRNRSPPPPPPGKKDDIPPPPTTVMPMILLSKSIHTTQPIPQTYTTPSSITSPSSHLVNQPPVQLPSSTTTSTNPNPPYVPVRKQSLSHNPEFSETITNAITMIQVLSHFLGNSSSTSTSTSKSQQEGYFPGDSFSIKVYRTTNTPSPSLGMTTHQITRSAPDFLRLASVAGTLFPGINKSSFPLAQPSSRGKVHALETYLNNLLDMSLLLPQRTSSLERESLHEALGKFFNPRDGQEFIEGGASGLVIRRDSGVDVNEEGEEEEMEEFVDATSMRYKKNVQMTTTVYHQGNVTVKKESFLSRMFGTLIA